MHGCCTMFSPDDINKNAMNENIEIMNPDVSTITFPEKARAASYNGQFSNCGQLNLISGEVERPKTGPGALYRESCKVFENNKTVLFDNPNKGEEP